MRKLIKKLAAFLMMLILFAMTVFAVNSTVYIRQMKVRFETPENFVFFTKDTTLDEMLQVDMDWVNDDENNLYDALQTSTTMYAIGFDDEGVSGTWLWIYQNEDLRTWTIEEMTEKELRDMEESMIPWVTSYSIDEIEVFDYSAAFVTTPVATYVCVDVKFEDPEGLYVHTINYFTNREDLQYVLRTISYHEPVPTHLKKDLSNIVQSIQFDAEAPVVVENTNSEPISEEVVLPENGMSMGVIAAIAAGVLVVVGLVIFVVMQKKKKESMTHLQEMTNGNIYGVQNNTYANPPFTPNTNEQFPIANTVHPQENENMNWAVPKDLFGDEHKNE